jgi:integrase
MGDALVPVAKVDVAAVTTQDSRTVPAIVDPANAFGRPIVVPALVADVGPRAAKRFANFFGSIPNDNTRAAYQRACRNFFAWCDANGLDELAAIEPIHVGAYVKSMAGKFEKPTVKQHLAAVRMLFDYLVVGQILAINPAHAVRGPKHSVKRGKTPVLSAAQARQLLDSIDISTVVGLRDRALIALMTFSFARVGAAVGMRVEDYFADGKRWGCASTKRAARSTRCRRITISKPISTPTCRRPGCSGRRERPCSAPPIGTAAH